LVRTDPIAGASRSELAFESVPQALVVVDDRGRIEQLNAAAEALLGVIGWRMAGDGERPAVEDALPWLAGAVRRVLAGADEAGLEAEVASALGPRVLAARVRRLRGGAAPAEGATGAVAIVEDLTARRAVDARLRFSERIDALGTLAAGLAHEVNNPLACVMAGLTFVASEHARLAAALSPAELDEARIALEEAHEAALRVGRIVRSLESFGRPALPLLDPVDATAVVRRVIGALDRTAHGRPRIALELRGPVLVRASEPLLAEVVDALVSNALGAVVAPREGGGEDDSPVVRISACASGGAARISVSDAGPGIPDEIRQRVFDPFFTTRSPGRGAGLGLSVCHGIVGALGGTLWLESAPGAGTTAVVTLPLAESSADALAPARAARAG
jgi:two-component system NtrC family sensor kinase